MLQQLFRKSEISWAVYDLSKAVGPIIDLVFVSLFIGTAGVTVIGYVSPLIMLFELIGTDISSGSRNKTSSLLGAGKIDEANSAFSTSVITGGTVSLTIVIGTVIFCSTVTLLLGARDPQIFAMTKSYILGYIVGLPFFSLTRILTTYLEIEGQYQRVNLVSIMTTVIDIGADAFVIFVLHGGMFAIGLATSLGYIIPFFVAAAFFLPRNKLSVLKFSFRGMSLKMCAEIMRIGAPAGIIKGSNSVGGMLINNMLTAFKLPYLVAAYGVFSQITVFIRSAWFSPANNLQLFASILIGEEDITSLKEIQKTSFIHAFICSFSAAAISFAFAAPLARIFLKSNDPEAFTMTVECIRIASLSVPFHAIVYVFNQYLMAVKRLRFGSVYSFMIECGSIVPVTLCMLWLIGYHGAWVSKVISMFILTMIAAGYVYMHKGGETFRDKMLLLPSDFGIKPEDDMALSASSTEEIVDLSRLAVAFASEHGADVARAKTFGLLTEELAGVLTEHGFSDGKTHNINARLLAKGEELIIRMRDDCKPFNMTEYYKTLAEDREQNAGLAIIMKMSKSVQYTNTLGVNNLIVRI